MLRNGHPPAHPASVTRSASKRPPGGSENVHQSITSVIFREKHQLISASSVDGCVIENSLLDDYITMHSVQCNISSYNSQNTVLRIQWTQLFTAELNVRNLCSM